MSSSRPVDVLRSALGETLGAGTVAVVLAPPGVGKSAVLVHVALAEMMEGRSVLHVAVDQTVDHVRAQYEPFAAGLGVARSAELDRHRMVHCMREVDFDVAKLAAHLRLLSDAGAFLPSLIVVDGLDADTVRRSVAHLAELAVDLSVPLWVSMRLTDGEIPGEVREAGTVGLRLTPNEGHVALSVLRNGGETALDVVLSPDQLLVPAGRIGSGDAVASDAITLYSTGAVGAEQTFGELAERFGLREVVLTAEGHRTARRVGVEQLSPRQLAAGDISVEEVSKQLGRSFRIDGVLIRRVLQLLWHVVSRSQKVLVVGVIQPDDTVKGGTGWSVELGRLWNKDVWVFDTERVGWFQWKDATWQAGVPILDATHIAATGTLKMTEEARAALLDLFQRSCTDRI